MPFALGYPLPHPSKHNSSPVSSRKLPLTCLTQSSTGFLLDPQALPSSFGQHGLVAERGALPYLTVWGADIGEAGPLSEWGWGRPSTCGMIPGGSFQPRSLLLEICVLHHGMGSGAQTTPPPPPDISEGTESQPIHHTRLHFFIRMEFMPGLGAALSE